HIDTFDPKPGRKTAGEFKPIRTSASGIEIAEILPGIAAQMKHAAIVRSVNITNNEHGRAAYEVLTGYTQTPQLIHPTMGAVVAHEMEQVGDLPSFVAVGQRALSSGYLGHECEAYFIGKPGQPDPYIRVPDGITDSRAARRMEMLTQMNGRFEQQQG